MTKRIDVTLKPMYVSFMTTTAAQATSIEEFINSAEVQRKISDTIRNCNELYVAEKLSITRREARAALKLTGRW